MCVYIYRGSDFVANTSYTALTVLLYGDYIYIGRHKVQYQDVPKVLVVVMFMVVRLLFDSSLSIQVWSSRPVAFSQGAAIAPLHYCRKYLLNLHFEPKILPPNLEFDIPKFACNKKKRGSRGE